MMDPLDRLARRSDMTGECWVWLGATVTNGKGYGYIRRGSADEGMVLTHRLSYELYQDESPEVVMHLCDNPPCWNPAHLRAGTVTENNRDMWNKGRGRNQHMKGDK